ncbi:MAG: M23 family metallopeptidase [Spirochaetales bacterium]
MKVRLFFVGFWFLLGLPIAWAWKVEAPADTLPGHPFPLRIYTPLEIEEVAVTIRKGVDAEAIVEGKAFRVFIEEEKGEALWVSLLGIPSTAPAGTYTVELTGGRTLLTTLFSIRAREFLREEIPLNYEMTRLRTEEDERKVQEWLELVRILNQFQPDALYHVEPFQLPVEGFRRTSLFGDRRTFRYIDGSTDRSIHTGIDFATPRGTPVKAAASGRVVFAGPRILTGNTIIIEHLPAVFSLYYHLDTIGVRSGQHVQRGEPIGTSGATGLVTGPHLHWEIRVGGIPVNPDAFLAGGPLDNFFQVRKTHLETNERR